jgi:DNA invertase Pin-like site-specific DNA recombinase
MSPRPQPRRCAIYTRKSSEEGLEQAFNSLDAQREACEAYIRSQRQEGWHLFAARFDDGGVSGSTLERPALQRLLGEIQRGTIDTVVVYKVDRLTRALSDFARLVEIFDRHNVAFVSVTQQFNTTSSMGRLTLNVLLSFAQFEREVTGERIRDKFAASRAKGMWMGGTVPLGYDLEDRYLVVNKQEAATVQYIFQRYAEVRCVRLLKAELDTAGICSKRRISAAGTVSGGTPFSRGALYALLRNRLYLGETVHKGKAHPGQHNAIVDSVLWESVQATLDKNRANRANGVGAKQSSLLAGLLFDSAGHRLTPVHTQRRGRRYRYYVSNASTPRLRLPAHELERLVLERAAPILSESAPAKLPSRSIGLGQSGVDPSPDPAISRATLLKFVQRIIVEPDRLCVHLVPLSTTEVAQPALDGSSPGAQQSDELEIIIPYRLQSCRGELRLLGPDGRDPFARRPNHCPARRWPAWP